MTTKSKSKSFTPGDRVKRIGIHGPVGTVEKVRTETISDSIKFAGKDKEPPTETVTVMWDNGTLSHFIPEGLEHA